MAAVVNFGALRISQQRVRAIGCYNQRVIHRLVHARLLVFGVWYEVVIFVTVIYKLIG